MGKLGRSLFFLVVLVGAAVGVYAWSRNGSSKDGGLKLVSPEKGSITEKAIAVGQIQPRQKFSIKSKISGIVKRAIVQVGDTVKAGDALFEIAPDPTPLEASEVNRNVESAEASLTRARSEYERIQLLERSGVVPKNDLDMKREAFELAQIALIKARQGQDLTIRGRLSGSGSGGTGGSGSESLIRSPAAGTVLTRAVNPGDPVVPLTSYQPGTELASVADMGELIFKGTVDEIDVGKMRVGLPTRIKVGALPSDVVTGKVARIAPQAQQKDGATLFDVEIELDPVTSGVTLRAGYSANADVIIREKKDVLTIPERLITFEDGGKKAFVELPGAGPKDEPRKVEVKLGISDGLNVEVLEGVTASDRLVQRPPKEIS